MKPSCKTWLKATLTLPDMKYECNMAGMLDDIIIIIFMVLLKLSTSIPESEKSTISMRSQFSSTDAVVLILNHKNMTHVAVPVSKFYYVGRNSIVNEKKKNHLREMF